MAAGIEPGNFRGVSGSTNLVVVEFLVIGKRRDLTTRIDILNVITYTSWSEASYSIKERKEANKSTDEMHANW